MSDKVYIIMATYNGDKYIEDQIKSIINQSYKNWELVIRDDCSKDNTLNILEKFEEKDPRIKVLRDNRKNLGCTQNFNVLLNELTTIEDCEYILFADQDDFWLENKIEKMMCEIKIREASDGKDKPILIHSNFKVVNENLEVVHESCQVHEEVYNNNKNKLNTLLGYNFIWGCTMLFNKSLLIKGLPIDVDAECHDYWFALIAATVGKIYYINTPLILYRKHSNNVTAGLNADSLANRIKRQTINRKKYKKSVYSHLKHLNAVGNFLNSHGDYPEWQRLVQILNKNKFMKAIKLYKFGIRKTGRIQTMLYYNLILF